MLKNVKSMLRDPLPIYTIKILIILHLELALQVHCLVIFEIAKPSSLLENFTNQHLRTPK